MKPSPGGSDTALSQQPLTAATCLGRIDAGSRGIKRRPRGKDEEYAIDRAGPADVGVGGRVCRSAQHARPGAGLGALGARNHFSTITLDRIDLDGRLVINGYEADGARFNACVREAAADQVRRGAAPVPQAVVFVKIYGRQGGAM